MESENQADDSQTITSSNSVQLSRETLWSAAANSELASKPAPTKTPTTAKT